jgi:D-alanyl-D-alanine carboxypeptidase/D-alanyl-D-alanine-endopeptidase (penicillin-binding protein 4)
LPDSTLFRRCLAAFIPCLLAVTAVQPASAADSTQASWTALRALQKDGARISASVESLTGSALHDSLNAQQRLSPASITKVVVAATALDVWPADKSFETRVMVNGRIKSDGKVDGDLILNGDGDSTLDHRDLWTLAGQVRASGVLSVTGDVVSAPPYGPLGCDNQDRCAALQISDSTYDVPLSGLAVDFGAWCIDVEPTTAGQPAALRACGGSALPIAVEGSITTGGAKSKENFWLSRYTKDGADILRVGGTVSPGERREVLRAMSDPALGAALLLRQMLTELGVKFGGSTRVHYGPPMQADSTIAKVNGLALREQLGRMLRYSNNYIADLLTLNIAAARAPHPPRQLGEAAMVLAGQMARKSTAGTSPPTLFSGSGLTPENAISAADMVSLLETQYRDAATFPAFYGGFVVPGQAPFAFLRGGSRDWRERVALKTGTMNDPYSVCAVAGYLRRKDGGWMAFAILVNGSDSRKHVPLYKAMEAIRKDIDALLDRY